MVCDNVNQNDNSVYLTRIQGDGYTSCMESLFTMMAIKKDADVEKISIKINLCDYKLPESGAVTDPQMLDALMKNLSILYPNAKIFITENDASGTKAETLFSMLNMYDFEEKYDCEVINLANSKWITKTINGRYFKEIEVPKIYEESDLIVNHPKLKTHSLTKMTCNLKNLFGCLHDKYKVKYHNQVDDVIVDINSAIKTDLCIVDANICHEGFQGPTYGTPKNCGLLIGGFNPVSVDSFSAKLMGFNPKYISHIKKSQESTLGEMDYKLIKDVADFNINDYRFEFDRLKYSLMSLFRSRL